MLKAPTEEGVLGQDLQLNGSSGALKLERSGTAVSATVTLPGTKVSQPTESCTVKLGGGKPIPLTPAGKPEGVPRYEAPGAECPLRFDVAEGGVMVTTLDTGPVCTFSAADCATTPVGLWGPAAATLIPRAGEFDTARGVADKSVRDNYKIMTQRARREDIRPIVAEQAAFSADREQFCRGYAREGTTASATCASRRTAPSPWPPASAPTPRPRPHRPPPRRAAPRGRNPPSRA